MYKYSKNEVGKNGTINPNYYKDKSPLSNKMAIDHMTAMFSVPHSVGFFKGQIFRYDYRAGYKENAEQDVRKIISYGYQWLKFIKRIKKAKSKNV